jgi:predicted kinase
MLSATGARTEAGAENACHGDSAQLWLVALKGAPGSGKSTLGRALSRHSGWPLVDKDDILDVLDGHTPEAGALAYETMFNIARRQLLQGLNVICDSPLAYRLTYENAARIAKETNACLAIVECQCPDEDVWRCRIDARQALDLPTHHTTDWAAVQFFQRRTAGDADYPIVHPHLVVNTMAAVSELCAQVMAWLDTPNG